MARIRGPSTVRPAKDVSCTMSTAGQVPLAVWEDAQETRRGQREEHADNRFHPGERQATISRARLQENSSSHSDDKKVLMDFHAYSSYKYHSPNHSYSSLQYDRYLHLYILYKYYEQNVSFFIAIILIAIWVNSRFSDRTIVTMSPRQQLSISNT